MSNVDIGRFSKKVVQLFWDPPPRNEPSDGPIWLLGNKYDCSPQAPSSSRRQTSPSGTDASSPPALSVSQSSETSTAPTDLSSVTEDPDLKEYDQVTQSESEPESDEDKGWPASFLDDFESRIWMTYRSNFAPIPRSQDPKANAAMSFAVRLRTLADKDGFTSDAGWGCMIRSGQAVLANAVFSVKLGREWRRGAKQDEERKLLSLFADDPSAPFSIHRFVEYGATACGKHPGEWFGPSAASRSIKALANGYPDAGMKVYVTGDGSAVYEDSFMRIAKSENGQFTPTLILVGTRLGIDRVNPVYWEGLKASLQMPQSIGIAGGRPSSSHYFVGTQGSYLFYLDPHYTRPALPMHSSPSDYSDEDIASCHLRRLRRIHLDEMDPSMLIAFLIRDENDWRAWRAGVAQVQGKSIVHVTDMEPSVHGLGEVRASAVDEVETFDDDEETDKE
ncbi:putative cysteine protease atg4 [Rhizodiscina lignyota]|uniref:Cysteine protease n=1 Tax=Rhizodiscina lignyota TaxID=1504668 RepID=A0A9P4MA61_9PEZI|nr:putative cysteine protease atg4 [Rhizodiscina lignyota]